MSSYLVSITTTKTIDEIRKILGTHREELGATKITVLASETG